jgi:hypothetical protein
MAIQSGEDTTVENDKVEGRASDLGVRDKAIRGPTIHGKFEAP